MDLASYALGGKPTSGQNMLLQDLDRHQPNQINFALPIANLEGKVT